MASGKPLKIRLFRLASGRTQVDDRLGISLQKLAQRVAGVSMRLNPGGFRELHWHAIAAEWAYVLEGRVRTTVISPDGQAETDEFQVGDIWYFPKGHGHALECLGNQPCHFGLTLDQVSKFPKDSAGIIGARI